MFRAKVSWRYILAGVVSAMAVSIILTLLGVALGFTVVDPMSNDPLSGLGITFGIWSVVSIIISLAVGGFIAGYFAGTRGGEHGYMVWAAMLVIGSIVGTMAVGSAMRTVASAAQSVGSGAMSVASSVGGGVADLASRAVDGIQDEINLDVDTDQLQGQVADVLRDTQVATLQPEFLRSQMREARGDLRRAVREVALDPDGYEQTIDNFLSRQASRVENITSNIDREAAVTGLMNNRNLPRAEAEQLVDNALAVYNQATVRAQEALNDAQDRLQEARAEIAAMAQRARIRADEMASSMARSAVLAAIALIVGAVIAWLAGIYGARQSFRHYHGAAAVYQERIIREPILGDS